MRATEVPSLNISIKDKGNNKKQYLFRPFLFKGGTKVKRTTYHNIKPSRAELRTISKRLPLIVKIIHHLTAQLASGKSHLTLLCSYNALRSFYRWADERDCDITIEEAPEQFASWVDHLIIRYQKEEISPKTAYDLAHRVGYTLTNALELGPFLIRNIKIPPPRKNLFDNPTQVEENYHKSLFFGKCLRAISEALSGQAIRGPLPIEIKLPRHSVFVPNLKDFNDLRASHSCAQVGDRNRALRLRAELPEGAPLTPARRGLINLRIEAELLIFISQTGMNLSQAFYLKMSDFKYRSTKNELAIIKVFKPRKGGEAIFKLYPEYLTHLKNYLFWRKIYTTREDELLFPFQREPGQSGRRPSSPFTRTRDIFKALKLDFICPALLRKVRTNWFLEQGLSQSLTAEFNQHTLPVLNKHYRMPNHRIAAKEITEYHERFDPTIHSPAPGLCASEGQTHEAISDTETNAPAPDCSNPAGCMFCVHHREDNSPDYIFSLLSYRLCKQLELDQYCPPKKTFLRHPAKILLERIEEKIDSFRERGVDQRAWTLEAIDKIREGKYHPAYDGFIRLMEAAL